MKEVQHTITSKHLGNQRTVWVREPECIEPRVTVILDAEFHRERVGATMLIDEMHHLGEIASSLFVFVSMESFVSRWIECPCHLPFAKFIDEELFPWIEDKYPVLHEVEESVIIGLSYTGLAAAFASLVAPKRFTRVVAQSGSFWWNDCWLSGFVERLEARPWSAFYLDVGSRETAENVQHKEDVLQVVSQIEGVRRFRDALARHGNVAFYVEFEGGHDFAAWRETLPDALRWALPAKDEE